MDRRHHTAQRDAKNCHGNPGELDEANEYPPRTPSLARRAAGEITRGHLRLAEAEAESRCGEAEHKDKRGHETMRHKLEKRRASLRCVLPEGLRMPRCHEGDGDEREAGAENADQGLQCVGIDRAAKAADPGVENDQSREQNERQNMRKAEGAFEKFLPAIHCAEI